VVDCYVLGYRANKLINCLQSQFTIQENYARCPKIDTYSVNSTLFLQLLVVLRQIIFSSSTVNIDTHIICTLQSRSNMQILFLFVFHVAIS